jgi:hypothetical protein
MRSCHARSLLFQNPTAVSATSAMPFFDTPVMHTHASSSTLADRGARFASLSAVVGESYTRAPMQACACFTCCQRAQGGLERLLARQHAMFHSKLAIL